MGEPPTLSSVLLTIIPFASSHAPSANSPDLVLVGEHIMADQVRVEGRDGSGEEGAVALAP